MRCWNLLFKGLWFYLLNSQTLSSNVSSRIQKIFVYAVKCIHKIFIQDWDVQVTIWPFSSSIYVLSFFFVYSTLHIFKIKLFEIILWNGYFMIVYLLFYFKCFINHRAKFRRQYFYLNFCIFLIILSKVNVLKSTFKFFHQNILNI